MHDFYVYGLFYPTDDPDGFGEPNYIGKGRGRRAWNHFNLAEMSRYAHRPLYQEISRLRANDVTLEVYIIYDELSEELAYAWEEELIRYFGRKDLDLGPLLNQTDGGNGGLSVGYKHSDEQKETIRQASVERWADPVKRTEIVGKMRAAKRRKPVRMKPHPIKRGHGIIRHRNGWVVVYRSIYISRHDLYCDALKARLAAEKDIQPKPVRKPRLDNRAAVDSIKIGKILQRQIEDCRRDAEQAHLLIQKKARKTERDEARRLALRATIRRNNNGNWQVRFRRKSVGGVALFCHAIQLKREVEQENQTGVPRQRRRPGQRIMTQPQRYKIARILWRGDWQPLRNSLRNALKTASLLDAELLGRCVEMGDLRRRCLWEVRRDMELQGRLGNRSPKWAATRVKLKEINRLVYFHSTKGWIARTPGGDILVTSRQAGLDLIEQRQAT